MSWKNCLIITSADGTKFPIAKDYAKLSKYMAHNLDSGGINLNCKSSLVEKLTSFLEHQKGIEPDEIARPLRHPELKKVTNKWNATFIDDIWNNKQDFYTLLSLAHVLEIKSLCDLCCAKIASIVKGKSFSSATHGLSI